MTLKRKGCHLGSASSSSQPPSKRSRNGVLFVPGKAYKAQPRYNAHPDSGVGENFHSVPYPLTLLPYNSWRVLHRQDDSHKDRTLHCAKCKRPRAKPTPHQRKLFLVAERLSWNGNTLSTKERMRNEEGLWEVNYELGIMDPAVEEADQKPGGTISQTNPYYPYDTENEAEAAFALLQQADRISNSSFNLWLGMINGFTTMIANDPPENTSPCRKEKGGASSKDLSRSQANPRTSLPLPPSAGAEHTREAASSGLTAPARTPREWTVQKLAAKGRREPAFKLVMDRVARGIATELERRMFQRATDCITQQYSAGSSSAARMTAVPTYQPELKSWEAIVQRYLHLFNAIPSPVFFKIAQRASISIDCELLMDSVATGTATTDQHNRFKAIVDACYSEHSSEQAQRLIHPHIGGAGSNDGNAANRSTCSHVETATIKPSQAPVKQVTAKYRSLPDFYSLLDNIERTSYIGMRFLECYAEYLQKDECTDCWFTRTMMDDDEFEALDKEIKGEI